VAGRSPQEAVSAFLHPIQQAASLLGSCKIVGSRSYASPRLGDTHHWNLCGGDGVAIRHADPQSHARLHFYASMSWRAIEDDREGYGPFRVTTSRYDYQLTLEDAELWALHWHPEGESDVVYPHVHLGSRLLDATSGVSNKAHLPTGRMSFESAVRWVIASGGRAAKSDWEGRLALAEAPHLLYRSWTQNRDVERSMDS
jgi:hypothetical protein